MSTILLTKLMNVEKNGVAIEVNERECRGDEIEIESYGDEGEDK